jgi:tetratricopeptide (TPR) repeat protein
MGDLTVQGAALFTADAMQAGCNAARGAGASGSGRVFKTRRMPWWIMRALLVCGLITSMTGVGMAYEAIDVIHDVTSLEVPTDLLKRPVPAMSGDAATLSGRFEQDWFLRKRNIAIGNEQGGTILLAQLQEEMIDLGASSLRPYSASLLREARILAVRGEYEKAVVLCRAAAVFGQILPEAHLTLAHITWMQNKLDITGVVQEMVQAARAYLLGFNGLAVLMINLGFLLLVAVAAFFGIFFLTQLVRYARLLLHELSERVPGVSGRLTAAMVLLLLLVFPLLVGWGLYGLCIVWLVLFWSYAGNKERAVYLLFLFFALLVPFWTGVVQRSSEVFYGDYIQQLIQHRDGLSDDATVSTLLRLGKERPHDPRVLFMLGTAYKKRGEYEKSRQTLQRAVSMNPGMAMYHNNLGNVLYAQREPQQALRMYEKAIALDPNDAAFHFNLSAVQRDLFMLRESEAEYSKARKMNPVQTSYYVTILGPSYNRMVIDSTLPWRALFQDFFREVAGGKGPGSLVHEFIMGQRGELTQAALLMFGLLVVSFLRRFFGVARRCEKCGKIFCKKCQTAVPHGAVCSQCVYVFAEGAGIGVKERTRKIIEIRRNREQNGDTGRLLGLLIPGGGHIYFGWLATGFVVLFIVVCCLAYGLFGDALAGGPLEWRGGAWDQRVWALVPGCFLYFLSVVHMYRLRQ